MNESSPKSGNKNLFVASVVAVLVVVVGLAVGMFSTTAGPFHLGAFNGGVGMGKTYYVDAANGKDQWSGVISTPQGSPSTDGPWRTISKVNSTSLSPGDTVFLRCGDTWREQLNISNAGANGSPVTIGRYGADCNAANKPMINGADVVSGWSVSSGKIYSAQVSSPVRQVFVDGRYMSLAHHPNKATTGSAFLTIAANSSPQSASVAGAAYITASQTDSAYLSGVDINNAGIHIRTVDWLIEDNTITGISGNAIQLQSVSANAINKGWGYYLDNKLWMLDSPGEWYWDSQTHKLYLWLPDGTDPDTHLTEASVRDEGISASDAQALHINNIAVSNAGLYGVHVSNPEEFILSGLEVKNSGNTGIFAAESDVVNGNLNSQVVRRIENSTISNSVRQAVDLQRIRYVTVTGNTTSETGTVGSPVASAAALRAGNKSDNTVISNNTIVSSGYNGIAFGSNNNIKVQNNLVHDSCKVLSDCGAIYTWNGATSYYFLNGLQIKAIPETKSWIIGNIVDGVGGGVDGTPRTSRDNYGIYLDNFSNAIDVGGNTVMNAGVGFHSNNAFNNYIHDNTIYGASKVQMDMVEGYGAPFGVVQGLVNGNTTPRYNTISNNILFPVVNAPSISLTNIPASAAPDTFGNFSNNRYSSLYGDMVVREAYSAEYPNRSYPYYKGFTLSDWRALRSQDMSSSTAPPFSIAPFKIDPTVVPTVMLDMTFDSGVAPYRVLTSGASVKWHPESECENSTSGGCMEFTPIDTSNTTVEPQGTLLDGGTASFSVKKGATYLVQFKLLSKLAHQNLALRIIGSSWTDVGFNNTENLVGLSNGQVIFAEQDWHDYAYVFTASEDTAAKVDFWMRLVPGPGAAVLIDNLSVKKVKVDFNDPHDDTNIVVNDTSVAKAVACPDVNFAHCGEYIDLAGISVVWPVVLPPYSSKIVVWGKNPNVMGTPATPINIPPPTIPFKENQYSLDITAPTTPQNLTGASTLPTEIRLSWSVSTDNIVVVGYHVYRNGSFFATVSTPEFVDGGLNTSTMYTYTVSAFDNSGNDSPVSAPLSVTTKASGEIITSGTTVAQAGSPVVLTKDLAFGMKDPEVATLQSFLKTKGFFPSTEETTTYFGIITQQAVIAYQSTRFIDPALGFVGPITRNAIMSESAASFGQAPSSDEDQTLIEVLKREIVRLTSIVQDLIAKLVARGQKVL